MLYWNGAEVVKPLRRRVLPKLTPTLAIMPTGAVFWIVKEYVLPDSVGLDTTAVSFGLLMPDNWMVAAKLGVLSKIAAAAEITSGIFDFITSFKGPFDRK